MLLSVDSGNCAALVLLDLSAAFDTVDHGILLEHLRSWVGIRGTALSWFYILFTGEDLCGGNRELYHLWGPSGLVSWPCLIFLIYIYCILPTCLIADSLDRWRIREIVITCREQPELGLLSSLGNDCLHCDPYNI